MDRDELHDLIALLKKQFEDGKVKINSAQTLRELGRVRLAVDGKVERGLQTQGIGRRTQSELRSDQGLTSYLTGRTKTAGLNSSYIGAR